MNKLIFIFLLLFSFPIQAEELADLCTEEDFESYTSEETVFWEMYSTDDRFDAVQEACWSKVMKNTDFEKYNLCHDITKPDAFQWNEIIDCTIERTIVLRIKLL